MLKKLNRLLYLIDVAYSKHLQYTFKLQNTNFQLMVSMNNQYKNKSHFLLNHQELILRKMMKLNICINQLKLILLVSDQHNNRIIQRRHLVQSKYLYSMIQYSWHLKIDLKGKGILENYTHCTSWMKFMLRMKKNLEVKDHQHQLVNRIKCLFLTFLWEYQLNLIQYILHAQNY